MLVGGGELSPHVMGDSLYLIGEVLEAGFSACDQHLPYMGCIVGEFYNYILMAPHDSLLRLQVLSMEF